jgi:adenine-specific DNA-methyltransferase
MASDVRRLNYIGSKFRLLEWLEAAMLEKTGWGAGGFSGRRVADLFGGTGIVSHHFRLAGAVVVGNDAELYSSVIVHAMTRSVLSADCDGFIRRMAADLTSGAYLGNDTDTAGFITRSYSPHNGCQRMFFTVDNARRIDYIRRRIEEEFGGNAERKDDYMFLLASLLVSADAVSNVPAVYGCFLKQFKEKAVKALVFEPIHKVREPASAGSQCYHSDVLADSLLDAVEADMVYLDPPYNERQYSKNYFPLNILALPPVVQTTTVLRDGVTGIPEECFMSPFCKKKEVIGAFEKLFSRLKAQWIFLSYSSESLITKTAMLELMGKYGEVSVVETDYKRFKSYEYNADSGVKEYLFCLQKGVAIGAN